MSESRQEATLARLQARRRQIQQELSQVERQIALARLRVVNAEQRLDRLNQSQRPAA